MAIAVQSDGGIDNVHVAPSKFNHPNRILSTAKRRERHIGNDRATENMTPDKDAAPRSTLYKLVTRRQAALDNRNVCKISRQATWFKRVRKRDRLKADRIRARSFN